ncbi:hypothetical protein PHMEG_00032773 [Phytophthora megakarya]|uniref:Uncharacterized protein n=1 Tax=Phytophthora megakarya TaxID=4795 RepID=A0A225UVA6_9STRA|nr:hypothetical protein PHMEG_00032773 [Phytophthora megakarya]
MLQMFGTVFELHQRGELPADKDHYPTLQPEELKGLIRLFQAQVVQVGTACQQGKNRLRDLTKSIFGSRRSLLDTIEFRENELKVRTATTNNPWAKNPLTQDHDEQEDVPMEEDNSIVCFRKDVYGAEENEVMRTIYTAARNFPSELRPSTEMEKKITQGILEGNILAQGLPLFLKLEGELYIQLPTQLPVYPDFQTRERLVGAILQGSKRGGFDPANLTKMLGETKQVCYNSQQHYVHLFFWTRETSTGWTKQLPSIPFRNRRFLLQNARPVDEHHEDSPSQSSRRVWTRQVGSDGVKNEQRHARYKVKLLNVSMFMDEAALDAFIRSKAGSDYTTFREHKYGGQIFQTGVWEIYFKSPGCPPFLDKYISWVRIQHRHATTVEARGILWYSAVLRRMRGLAEGVALT